MPCRHPIAAVLLGFACAFSLLPAVAYAAELPRAQPPVIQSIFPRGGRRGSDLQIAIQGKHLAGASALRFSGTGLTARILECQESRITAQVTIAKDAAVGRRDLRVFTPQGTFVQVFQVGALPEQLEKEPNDDWSAAPLVPLPIVINGKLLAGDYDCFRFRADAGHTLVFDMSSARSGTRFDGVLALLDAQGRELAAQDDYYFDKDPHLVYRIPQTGEYIIRLSGFHEAGSDTAEYRMLIGELPSLSHVFPAGARRGKTVRIMLAGDNLRDVERISLDQAAVQAEILEKTDSHLETRLTLPADLALGFYRLRVRTAAAEMPDPLIFVVSDQREIVLAGVPSNQPLDLSSPLVINGAIHRPKQADTFWIDVAAGEQITFQADGMALGNFLDPALTIFDAAGNVEAYIDESAPNGFDKEPPNLDFHLDHRFPKAGRYRVEFRDAGLRGRDSFVYRLRIGRSEPDFELVALTNQVSVTAGGNAALPVRVRRLGGWDTPVKVWLESLPARVESQSITAEPVNTRFRGTFGEDFFFDGSNVDLPLQAHAGAPPGCYPLRVRARGSMHGKTLERTAVVWYPWQQTGYLRGRAEDQDLLLTVAAPAALPKGETHAAK